MSEHQITITELRQINIEGGYVIDGFPSVSPTNTIAAESIINTLKFELAAFIDSDRFIPVSIVKNGMPYHPSNIFVNDNLRSAVFSSHVTIPQPLQYSLSKLILNWAQTHRCSFIISSVPFKTTSDIEIMGVASTDKAKAKLKEAGIPIISEGTIPGLPGLLLNQGRYTNQNVIVLLFNLQNEELPYFKTGVRLCHVISKLIPGSSCDLSLLENEAEKAEQQMKKTEKETEPFKSSIYL